MNLIEQRWVHAIWCDDVRHEIGNKPSFMGVYTGDLVIPARPAILTRLAVYVSLGTPMDQPFKHLTIRIEKNDDPKSIAAIGIPAEQLEEIAHAPSNLETDGPTGLGMSFIIQMGGISITDDTKWIKVWVDTEAETLDSFKLKISSPANAQQYPQQLPI